ncbi:transporter bos1 [Patellaria atrata CBS 101060]|uniref:Protein transport protein BOS1 n=1 Tax=Patellaria atrata CBS 101060 TaxID=1346257 RepID=A0A9P4S6Y2_9PEZI|nr:transporter bos1 [Patellaria atrata CBS 101060]
MNVLFNSALRQSSAIRRDLDAFAESSTSSPALLGQINASLTSFNRTIDDYNKLAKQELVPEKQRKAQERVKTFRTELADYRDHFSRLKQETEARQHTQQHAELLGRRPHHTSTPENPYSRPNPSSTYTSPFGQGPGSESVFGTSPADATRESHALREQSFFSRTNAQLDEYLDRGRAVLGDLGEQREMLKGTQKTLYNAANTLGISGDTIRMVERRARQDKWIFFVGVIVFFLFCYLVLKWLR